MISSHFTRTCDMAFAFAVVSPAVRARLAAAVHDDNNDNGDTSSSVDNRAHRRDYTQSEENGHAELLGVSARLRVVYNDADDDEEEEEDASPSAQDNARLPLRVAARLGLRKGQLAELTTRKRGEAAWGMSRLVRVNGFTTDTEDEATAAVAIDVRTIFYPT